MRLLIIDPAVQVPEEQGVAQVLRDWPGDARVVLPALRGDGPRPGDGYEGIDGVVIFGSAASVYDDYPWLADLKAWLAPILRGEPRLPLFGICFGHQLVADVAGGRVGYLREDHSKLVGYEDTVVGGRLLGGRPTPLRVICSHREEVKVVPPGWVVTGERPASVRDAMEHESLPIFSVQFHPEARDVFTTRIGLPREGIDDALESSSFKLLDGFRRIVLAERQLTASGALAGDGEA